MLVKVRKFQDKAKKVGPHQATHDMEPAMLDPLDAEPIMAMSPSCGLAPPVTDKTANGVWELEVLPKLLVEEQHRDVILNESMCA